MENGTRLFHVPALPTLSEEVRCPCHPAGASEAPPCTPNEGMQLIFVICDAWGDDQLKVSSCSNARLPPQMVPKLKSLIVPTIGSPFLTGSPLRVRQPCGPVICVPADVAVRRRSSRKRHPCSPVGVALYQLKNLTTPRPEFPGRPGPMPIGCCAMASTMPRTNQPVHNREQLSEARHGEKPQ